MGWGMAGVSGIILPRLSSRRLNSISSSRFQSKQGLSHAPIFLSQADLSVKQSVNAITVFGETKPTPQGIPNLSHVLLSLSAFSATQDVRQER